MQQSHRAAYEAVLSAARDMVRTGLTSGTAGNVSARLDDGRIVITPTSLPYDQMTSSDLAVLGPDGEQVAGARAPSSERLLHVACYQAFPEVGSVLHCHPGYATIFACARQPVPPVIDEAVLFVGGEVQVAEYAMSGTAEVGDNAVRVLGRVGSALLANHGMVTVAASPRAALHQAGVVEHCARVAWGVRALGGHVPLPEQAIERFSAAYLTSRQPR
ncbi:MAG TPA: class II aldolase/adducin family protein [Streptosporangiaceae bacterium]|nr:class II aldolase/adducin family protein [Streptosporangiaceae bacterium]